MADIVPIDYVRGAHTNLSETSSAGILEGCLAGSKDSLVNNGTVRRC